MRAVLKDGTVYEGLFHNPIFDRGFGVVLHMARKKVPPYSYYFFFWVLTPHLLFGSTLQNCCLCLVLFHRRRAATLG